MPKRKGKKEKEVISETKVGISDLVFIPSNLEKPEKIQNKTMDFTWGVIGNLVASFLITISTILTKMYLPNISDDRLDFVAIGIPLFVLLFILLAIALIYLLRNYLRRRYFLRMSLTVLLALVLLLYSARQANVIDGINLMLIFQKFLSGAGLGILLMIALLFSRRKNKVLAFKGGIIVISVSGVIGIFTPTITSPIINFIVLSIAQLFFLLFLGRKRITSE